MKRFLVFTFLVFIFAFFLSSCGYRLVGSRLLPFNSITIKPVKNNTYEPRLEERMHVALSDEFINQGIEIRASGGEADLETTITEFALGAVGAVDETIKEQEIIMYADMELTSDGKVTEFKSIRSPIKITFQTTGTVSQAAARKEVSTEKACREIAREIVSRVIIEYAK